MGKYSALILLTVVLAAGIVWYQDTGSFDEKEGLENITVQMSWTMAGHRSGWVSSQMENFYANHGLNVKVEPGRPNVSPITLVASGAIDFGIASSDEVLFARAKGIPVVAVGALMRKNPLCFASRKEDNIQSPQDWTGRTLEIAYGKEIEYQYQAMLNIAGVKREDIKEKPASYSLLPLIEKKVDATGVYIMNEPITLRKKGIPHTLICAADMGINFYAEVIVTNEDMVKKKPELVRAFLAGSQEGHEWARNNQDKNARNLLKHTPTLDYADAIEGWKESLAYIWPEGNTEPWAYMRKEDWQQAKEILVNYASLPEKVDISSTYTNIYLPQ